jgi:4-amino-4-deoxy-L-arabinose transferase-like glycosyltransferase
MAKAKPVAKPSPLRVIESRSWMVALALIAIAVIRIISTYSELSATWDEPGHMACGLQYLAEHQYRYETQHPPVARMASAMGPFLAGARPLKGENQDLEGVAVMYHSGDPAHLLTLMRFGILPFFVLTACVVFLWARRHFGGATAAIAAGLFTLCPTVLAHAGVATTDMPLTAGVSAAFFAMLLWAETPTWKHSVLFGLATALAVTTKFTSLGYLPAAAVLALVAYLAVERPAADKLTAAAKARALPLGAAVLTGAVAIWAVYGFNFGLVGGWNVSLPAPELFDGVRSAFNHNTRGHAAYLLGQISNSGWWYFFPVVMAVKLPIAWMLLLFTGIGVCIWRRAKLVYWMPLAFSAGILLPAMTSHVNIGLRHILPIFTGFSILGAIGLVFLIERATWTGLIGAVLVAWLAISGFGAHPNYIGYFNETVGDHPERVVLDSDFDWGQNDIRLARRLREVGATEVAFSEFNFTPQQLMIWPGLPRVTPINPLMPADGWNVVSPTRWMLRRYGIRDERQPWFPYLRPVEKVGSLWLYYVAPGSVRRQ